MGTGFDGGPAPQEWLHEIEHEDQRHPKWEMEMRIQVRNAFQYLVSFALLTTSVLAQPADRNRVSFQIPKVGGALPEVSLWDQQGRPFSTKTLKEHYTVLVFGCLT